jgi:hypothetical protein
MENNETTTETPETETTTEAAAPEATEITPEQPADPSVIGRLTPEEQNAMMRIRAESQQLLAKVGEHELLKLRIMARVEELDDQGQEIIKGITQRLGLPDNTPWHGLQDGTIRLVNKPVPAQTQGGGGADAS